MEPSSAPGAPQRVIGRYALYAPLAAGGMATVHLGRLLGPVGFARTVAIKRLHEHFANDPEFVSGFLDEARLAARIRHPNVVPTLDVVATEGQLFLVMEYVLGEALSRLVKGVAARGETVPVPIASGIMVGVLQGLHAAHEARNEKGEPLHIVHRDVSPQNVLVGVDGVPRVLDFGVAKAVGRLQNTASGQLKGKVAYMSPEQLQAGDVDRRTDVFAAATVLWETLTARRLFGGDNEGAVLQRVLFAPIEAPSRHARQVSPELDAIVLKGLERDVDKRWQSAQEMAVALEECVPPATARQIGAWVEASAREALEERSGRVAEIESASSDTGDRVSHVLAEIRQGDDPVAHTQPSSVSVATPTGVPSRKGRSAWVVTPVAVAALGLGVLATALLFRSHQPSRDEAGPGRQATPPVTAPAQASAADAPPAASVAPSAAASAPPTASATAAASAAPSAGAGVPSPAHHASTTTAAHAHAPAPHASARIDCTDPFTRDAIGRKLWKPECVGK